MQYRVEFTVTVDVEAEDAFEAESKARNLASIDDAYVYVDGEPFN